MLKQIVFSLSILLSFPVFAGNSTNDSFSQSKKYLKEVYADHRETIYCKAKFNTDNTIILPEGFETKSNPDKNELTISYTPTDNSTYQTAYRIIKEKPSLTGYRVSEDPYRETGFTKVDGLDMVAYYEMNDPIVIYLTPGAYFTVNTGPSLLNPKKYSDYGGTNKHAEDTFGHTIVPMLISCGDYPATNVRSFRENAFDASKYTVTKTIESDNSESESVTITGGIITMSMLLQNVITQIIVV